MKYLPFENYVLTTNLSVDEVRNRIISNIEAKRTRFITSSNNNTSKPYEGTFFNNTFKISRIINYKNSFLPEITGEISQAWGKTEISIKMKPVIYVLIFMAIWLGGVALACIGVLVVGIINFKDIIHNGFSPMVLTPFGMSIFGYLLITFGFKYESKIAKEYLKNLFEAQYKD
jgi:hypothetical protein